MVLHHIAKMESYSFVSGVVRNLKEEFEEFYLSQTVQEDYEWSSFSDSFLSELSYEMDQLEKDLEYTIMVRGSVVKTLLNPNMYHILESENLKVENQEGIHCLYCGVMGAWSHTLGDVCVCHGCPVCLSRQRCGLKQELQDVESLQEVNLEGDAGINLDATIEWEVAVPAVETPNVRRLRGRE